MKNSWHNASIKEVLQKIKVDPQKGLPNKEARERQNKYGKNVLEEKELPSRFRIFLEQFKSPLIFILAIAGIVTLFMAEYTDALVIWAAVILNTLIGYFQENKATRALSKLRKILKVKAKVIRNGNQKEIPQEELVPGDVIILESGDKIPADARIIESWDLKTNEAILTGEWKPSKKGTKTLEKDTSLADRKNMVYMGSIVANGGGKAVVVSTSDNTEIGRVSTMVQEIEEEKTPYQKKIKKFSWSLSGIIGLVTVFIFLEGIFTGGDFIEMFTLAVAIAVAAIPEGLPVAITAILAVGMQLILKKKGLVRKLTSAETLGSSSIIATDKTLTLTEGKMEAQKLFTLDNDKKELGYKIASLANNAFIENPEANTENWTIKGSPTDKALIKAGIDYGISFEDIEEEEPLAYKMPFNSSRKYSAAFHKDGGKTNVYISGAPEVLIDLSDNLSKKDEQEVLKKLEEFTSKGFRVVALGYKEFPKDKKDLKNSVEKIDFIGLIVIYDPIRKGVKKAIKLSQEAGIKIIMVTGDHVETARFVANKLGINRESKKVIEGRDLEKMSDEELEEELEHIAVFARVEPKHKMRIINACQKRGEVIAMTGDGINDAPALQKSNIGIALGSGTDVAKEVSDLVLLGDKFSIIPAAIRQGRIIVDNIRKVITYLLSSAFSELILIGSAVIMGWPLPVTALQILWVNLIEDALPGISFTFEKEEKGVMERKPEPQDTPLLNTEMKTIITIISLVSNFVLIGIFFYLFNSANYTIEHIRTVIFVALAIDSLFFVFSCKNLNRNIWQYNPFSNKFLNISVLISLFLMVAAVYTPLLQSLLSTVALGFIDWLVLTGFGFLNLMIIESLKWFFIEKTDYL